jgi:hypothetical protein
MTLGLSAFGGSKLGYFLLRLFGLCRGCHRLAHVFFIFRTAADLSRSVSLASCSI